jgi:hypothetical protein
MGLMPTGKARHAKEAALLFMSAARSRYMKASGAITQFLEWVVDSAIHLDYAVRDIAKSERLAGSPDESLRRKLAVGAGASRKIWVYYRLMTEMALSRAVDNYLTYLTELLSLIFRARPESLRSGEEVRLDFVLAHSTRASLINAIIDRKVNQLSYQGMRDLAQFFLKRLGFELFQDEGSLDRAILLVEIRNLIVHARGIVNETFIQRVANPPVPFGKPIKLTINDVQTHIVFLAESVSDLERRAHDKFGIKLPYKIPKLSAPTRN